MKFVTHFVDMSDVNLKLRNTFKEDEVRHKISVA